MRVVIFSGGEYDDGDFYHAQLKSADVIIAADRGGEKLLSLGVSPHFLVGDMDSIDRDKIDLLRNKGAEVIIYPAKKDATDTELALDLALEKGATEITIFGALGRRIDHALANLSLLFKAEMAGVHARIVDGHQELYLLKPEKENRIPAKKGDTVSLISLSAVTEGIYASGLEYPLEKGALALLSPLGVSNVVTRPDPRVRFKRGALLLVIAKKV